ncbi:MAG: hypothetical protein AB7O66_08990 [Limisphaerales bacterium]
MKLTLTLVLVLVLGWVGASFTGVSESPGPDLGQNPIQAGHPGEGGAPAGGGVRKSPGGSSALEALRRLKGMDFESNPSLKAALTRVLDASRGTPAFVEIVRDFGLKGREQGLLEVAGSNPSDPSATQAIRLVLDSAGPEPIGEALKTADADRRAGLLQAVADSADSRSVPILVETLLAEGTSTTTRATAIRGLARTESGARELLRIGAEDRLDDPARTTAGLALAQSRWPGIRAEAAKVLPPPRSADGGELPSVSELVGERGDAVRGARVFASERASCGKCHRVGDVGTDYGPALSQIGTKLGRQALYESILDPSSGISFGYEGWSIETRGGDEVFGILASETPDELAIRQPGGASVRVKQSEVVRRERQKLSVMPAGLASVLTRQELVDLVEYLTTLRAPESAP